MSLRRHLLVQLRHRAIVRLEAGQRQSGVVRRLNVDYSTGNRLLNQFLAIDSFFQRPTEKRHYQFLRYEESYINEVCILCYVSSFVQKRLNHARSPVNGTENQ
ncbi:hypothetical protein TNCV_5031721 [Trichonephila clavipes]|nr:hypothetical protein TNCV_5031721 [Trichonephila clavipes]